MLDEIRLIDLIRNEGIPVRESSKGGRFKCPFHSDKHPSAFAYRNTNRFICFGCGEQGDAIDFIMKLKDLAFKNALTYLGIDGKRKIKTDDTWRLKKDLMNAFRDWERQFYDELATIYRAAHKVMKGFKTMEEVEQFAVLYHEIPLLEYRMDIVLCGNDEQKYQLFKEVSGEF